MAKSFIYHSKLPFTVGPEGGEDTVEFESLILIKYDLNSEHTITDHKVSKIRQVGCSDEWRKPTYLDATVTNAVDSWVLANHDSLVALIRTKEGV